MNKKFKVIVKKKTYYAIDYLIIDAENEKDAKSKVDTAAKYIDFAKERDEFDILKVVPIDDFDITLSGFNDLINEKLAGLKLIKLELVTVADATMNIDFTYNIVVTQNDLFYKASCSFDYHLHSEMWGDYVTNNDEDIISFQKVNEKIKTITVYE